MMAKWACVGCGQGVDYHGNPITEDERAAWCYNCAEAIERVTKGMGGARCRNCGNTGISPWTGKPCWCPAGQALARIQADNGVEVVSEMADENDFGGKPDQDTLDAIAEAERAEAIEEAQRMLAQASKPRAIIRHFAVAMERKLAANDGVKGGWRASKHQAHEMRWKALQHVKALREEVDELVDAVIRMDSLRREANAEQVHNILMEAADCALYAMMIADVVGALPPTDERGR